jgi:hypothetical protein
MCIVIGKYFEDKGWVALKNRDRNYVPEISFKKKFVDGLEIMYFWDNITQYAEGLNSAGVGVLSASLQVMDDEKEIDKTSKHPSKDGKRIRKALTYPTVKAVAMSLIEQKLTGNTLVFDKDHMYLLEGAWRPGEYKDGGYSFKIQEIPKNKQVVRTNHGIWLDWAGYQLNPESAAETLSRYSSESRRTIAEIVTLRSESPEEVLNGLTENFTGNPQMNALRTTTTKKKMRTTSQIMIIPSERTMYVRPVQSNFKFNFWELNVPDQKCWVEILSNRILYQNLKDKELGNDKPFTSNLSHTDK